jgi:hypothetical protein
MIALFSTRLFVMVRSVIRGTRVPVAIVVGSLAEG